MLEVKLHLLASLFLADPTYTAQCINTGLELSPKTSGKTALCEEGRAESGAVVADEVLEHLVANWQHLPEHIKLAIQALVEAGGV